jgi:hypothetical protein
MKTALNRSILTILVALTLLVSVTTALAHRATRGEAHVGQQSDLVLPPSAYSDLLNGLAAGGR